MSRHRSREDEIRILARRAKVANLLLRGTINQQEILHQLGMEPDQHSTVSRDIKAIKAEWRERTVDDFSEARQREADRLLLLLGEYMAAWERSKVEKHSTRTKRKTKPGKPAGDMPPVPETSDEAEVKKEFRDGNPAFLDGAMKCHGRLCELFGLDVTKRSEIEELLDALPDWLGRILANAIRGEPAAAPDGRAPADVGEPETGAAAQAPEPDGGAVPG